MPQITSYKIPAALFITGFVMKVTLSVSVSDSLGTWVGGILGFLSFASLVVYAWQDSRRRNASETSNSDKPA